MSTPVMHSSETNAFDIAWVRGHFPSLSLQYHHHGSAFLDGPAGTQVPQQVMDAVQVAVQVAKLKEVNSAFGGRWLWHMAVAR